MTIPEVVLGNTEHLALRESRSSAVSLDLRRYWDTRLAATPGLQGVGYLRLGRAYNEWMYRVRTDVFRRLIHNWNLNGRALKVLDVGSGTGHYIREWLRSGAAHVVGSDFSETAIRRLRSEFPGIPIRQFDIGASDLPSKLGRYDVVSAFDVLFHIVDDDAYQRALRNCFLCCRPGGYFVFSELFLRRRTCVKHMVSRSAAEITQALRSAGFIVIDRVPMFVIMNYPADAGTLVKLAWSAMIAPAMVSEWAGDVLGRALAPFERHLVKTLRESATTEIMLCRRPGRLGQRRHRVLSRVHGAALISKRSLISS